MQYRRLGRTGLMVSAVGFGGVSIQRLSMKDSVAIIRRAHELGMNIIDSARTYTDSEDKIGEALLGQREDWIIATKSPDRTREGIKKDFRDCLKALKTDYIDIFQVHWLNDEESFARVFRPDGAVAGIHDLIRDGYVRHIGVSAHRLDLILKAIATDEFETVQFAFNAVEVEKKEALDLAKSMNVGTIGMKPVGGGNIRNVRESLKYILSEGMDTVIPGMESIQQVEANALVGIEDAVLTEAERDLLFNEAAELGNNFCRRCGYCMRNCPAGLDIPSIFTMDNEYVHYNMPEIAIAEYAEQKVKADECQDCGQCEEHCPYELPIRQKLQDAHRRLAPQ